MFDQCLVILEKLHWNYWNPDRPFIYVHHDMVGEIARRKKTYFVTSRFKAYRLVLRTGPIYNEDSGNPTLRRISQPTLEGTVN
jgi:hypothetical protein